MAGGGRGQLGLGREPDRAVEPARGGRGRVLGRGFGRAPLAARGGGGRAGLGWVGRGGRDGNGKAVALPHRGGESIEGRLSGQPLPRPNRYSLLASWGGWPLAPGKRRQIYFRRVHELEWRFTGELILTTCMVAI